MAVSPGRTARCIRERPSNARELRGRDPQPNSPAGSNRAVLKSVGGTADTPASGPVQNVGIDHRRFQILVPEQPLDRPDIISLTGFLIPTSRTAWAS